MGNHRKYDIRAQRQSVCDMLIQKKQELISDSSTGLFVCFFYFAPENRLFDNCKAICYPLSQK